MTEGLSDEGIKKSNLGFVMGVLVVALIVMSILKSGIFDKESEKAEAPEKTNNFEIIEEPEITLLDDNLIEAFSFNNSDEEVVEEAPEEIVEVLETEEISVHDPVDTALGDNPYLLVVLAMMGGVGLLGLSKKLA